MGIHGDLLAVHHSPLPKRKIPVLGFLKPIDPKEWSTLTRDRDGRRGPIGQS